MKDNIELRAWNPTTSKFEYLTIVHKHSIMTSLPIPSMGQWDNLEPFELCSPYKDQKGNKLYEGDICIIEKMDGEKVYRSDKAIVVFEEYDDDEQFEFGTHFGWAFRHNDGWVQSVPDYAGHEERSLFRCEKIGNIHEQLKQ